MYDPKSEASEFIGASRQEAVAKACQYYGVEVGELRVRELGDAVSGAVGRVVVVAQPEGARARRGGRSDERGERGERSDRGDRGERESRGARGGRDRDRGGRGGRGGRGDRGDRGDRGERRDRSERPERGERRERPVEASEAPDLGPEEASVGTASGPLKPIGEYILGVIERMALGPFEIRESEEADLIVYQLSGPAAEQLAGGEGRTADALQLVANQAALRIAEDHKRVVVDVEGDRANREDFLARAAQRAAKRAQETGRAVALEAMNGKDRRSIHVALRDVDGVATMSIGSGRYRQVLVVPEGAPEYEEARRAAEEAASLEL
jgi:predicted RNA-binding protein Jag